MKSVAETERSFGFNHFGEADLGDKRRTDRLVEMTDRLVHRPGGTLPQKLTASGDLDAAYRLCKSDKFTHEAVMTSSRKFVLQQVDEVEGDILVVHDTTEFDYTTKTSLHEELGEIGNGKNRGLIAHHSLAYDPQRGEAIGLVNQLLMCREKSDPNATRAEKAASKARESLIWLTGTEVLPSDRRIIDVCDRGADTFEFLEHECSSGRRFVIRSHHDRSTLAGHEVLLEEGQKEERRLNLRKRIESSEPLGGYTFKVPQKRAGKKKKKNGKASHPARKTRIAKMLVSATALRICPPRQPRGSHGTKPLQVWVVRVWEPNPPAGEEPIEWRLITNNPTDCLAGAIQVVDWYRARWVIEEFHKAQKTGFSIEDLQMRSLSRLLPMIGWLSIAATTLLRLRDAARAPDAKTRPAREIIDADYIDVLSTWRYKRPHPEWSVHDFIMALAKMGGHRNRKGDGLPGWITLWRGWSELVSRVDAVRRDRRSNKQCAYR